jgi:hypothetical protein
LIRDALVFDRYLGQRTRRVLAVTLNLNFFFSRSFLAVVAAVLAARFDRAPANFVRAFDRLWLGGFPF